MGEVTRRGLLRTTGHIAAAAGLGGLALRGGWLAVEPATVASKPALDREVRIGYLPITDASALLVAHERGLLAAAGLPSAKPILFRSWDALAQALAVGDVDVVHLLMPFALQLRLGKKVPLPKAIPAGEIRTIDTKTTHRVYSFAVAQAPQGDLVFVLAPVPA